MKLFGKILEFFAAKKRIMIQAMVVVLLIAGVGMVAIKLAAETEKPVMVSASIAEIMEKTPFESNNEIIFAGERFSNIVAVYINGEWQEGYQAVCESDESMRIMIPSRYYAQAGKITVAVERKINANMTVMSNMWTIPVLKQEEGKPEISDIFPKTLCVDGSPYQTVTLYGNNFSEGDIVQVNDVNVSAKYHEDGSISFRLSCSDYCSCDSLKIRVVKEFDGYPTQNHSNFYVLNVEKADAPELNYSWTENHYIGHAFGAVDGIASTNTLEAFEENYAKGQRVFEVEFTFTSDGVLICRHDFEEEHYGVSGEKFEDYEKHAIPKSWASLKKAEGAYTILCFDDVCNLLKKYPDIHIVTDTKYINTNAIYEIFSYMTEHAKQIDESVLSRFIVQIYNQEMYEQVLAIYPFASFIYTLYQSADDNQMVLDFVDRTGIRVITMPPARAEEQKFVDELNDRGCMVYVYTINSDEEAANYSERGIYGFYTDVLTEEVCEVDLEGMRDNYFQTREQAADPSVSAETGNEQDAVERNYKAFLSYLDDLKSERYIVCMAVTDDAYGAMTDEIRNKLAALGLNGDVIKERCMSYAALIDGGEVVFQEESTEAIAFDYVSEEDVTVHLESANVEAGNKSSIMINNVECSVNARSLNIAVYDKLTEEVIDSLCFDLWEGYTIYRP